MNPPPPLGMWGLGSRERFKDPLELPHLGKGGLRMLTPENSGPGRLLPDGGEGSEGSEESADL